MNIIICFLMQVFYIVYCILRQYYVSVKFLRFTQCLCSLVCFYTKHLYCYTRNTVLSFLFSSHPSRNFMAGRLFPPLERVEDERVEDECVEGNYVICTTLSEFLPLNSNSSFNQKQYNPTVSFFTTTKSSKPICR